MLSAACGGADGVRSVLSLWLHLLNPPCLLLHAWVFFFKQGLPLVLLCPQFQCWFGVQQCWMVAEPPPAPSKGTAEWSGWGADLCLTRPVGCQKKSIIHKCWNFYCYSLERGYRSEWFKQLMWRNTDWPCFHSAIVQRIFSVSCRADCRHKAPRCLTSWV